jgi:hypothetical protein
LPGAPPLGPLGPDVQEPLCGVPGTVGIAGLADRILSGVQYPELACDGGAIWLAPFCANIGRATTTVEITSASIARKARSNETPIFVA